MLPYIERWTTRRCQILSLDIEGILNLLSFIILLAKYKFKMPLKTSLYNTVLYIANIINTTLPMNYFLYFDWSFSRIFLEKKYISIDWKFLDMVNFFSVMDCRLSEWSTWSSCDSNCGRGVARRSRHVIHPAANGGSECEALDQTRSCTGEGDCSSRKNREIVSAFSGKYSVFLIKIQKITRKCAKIHVFQKVRCCCRASTARSEWRITTWDTTLRASRSQTPETSELF